MAYLELKHVTKRFGSVIANDDVSLSVEKGHIHALLGENGAGKSTLMNVLYGLYAPTEGEIWLDGKLLDIKTPKQAIAAGIGMVHQLFELLRKLTADGLTIIFITHKLGEVMDICDECTVIRQGRVAAANLPICEIKGHEQLAELMVGKSIDLVTHKSIAKPGNTVLKVQDLHYTNAEKVARLKGMDFEVHAGEIVGVAGVDGNGQSELVRCITGLLKPDSGTVTLNGIDVTGDNPKQILEQGVAHIPEDRYKMAMVKELTVNENLILMCYDKAPYSKHGILQWKEIARLNEALCEKYEVKTPSINEQAGHLSGGNQQKFVVGRELDRAAKLIIAVYPDRGLDIGTTKYIQSRLVEERDRGAAILLLSTELDEILELSDTILVVYDGRIMAQIPQQNARRETIGLLMAGVKTDDKNEFEGEVQCLTNE